MKCKNCGYESEKDFAYCVNCGAAAEFEPVAEPVSLNPAADKVLPLLQTGLFLAVCILMTVSTAASICSGSISVINILITIFLWCAYSSAQKGYVDVNQLRNVSGTVYASYIITNVLAGIIAGLGILCAALISQINIYDIIDVFEEFSLELSQYNIDLYDISRGITSFLGVIIAVVFILIAVAVFVINILGVKKIHRFIKSVYTGVAYQNPNFEKAVAAKNWIMFFAVISGVSALGSISSFSILSLAASGCQCAALVIVYILIDRYFVDKINYGNQYFNG